MSAPGEDEFGPHPENSDAALTTSQQLQFLQVQGLQRQAPFVQPQAAGLVSVVFSISKLPIAQQRARGI